jgi:hypothetical protein
MTIPKIIEEISVAVQLHDKCMKLIETSKQGYL